MPTNSHTDRPLLIKYTISSASQLSYRQKITFCGQAYLKHRLILGFTAMLQHHTVHLAHSLHHSDVASSSATELKCEHTLSIPDWHVLCKVDEHPLRLWETLRIQTIIRLVINKVAFQSNGNLPRTGYTDMLLCSYDFDLHPTTLLYKLDLKMYVTAYQK